MIPQQEPLWALEFSGDLISRRNKILDHFLLHPQSQQWVRDVLDCDEQAFFEQARTLAENAWCVRVHERMIDLWRSNVGLRRIPFAKSQTRYT